MIFGLVFKIAIKCEFPLNGKIIIPPKMDNENGLWLC